MEKNSSISNFKQIPSGFIVLLILALLFEAYMAFVPEYKAFDVPFDHTAMRLKGEVVDQDNNYDVLILGDCLGWAGIRPALLDEQLNINSYNLSVNAAQTYLMSYVLLKRYLDNSKPKPRLVVLQLSTNSLLGRWHLDADDLKLSVLPYFRADKDLYNEFSFTDRLRIYKYKILGWVPSVRRQYALKKGLFNTSFDDETYKKYLKYYIKEKGYFNEDMDPRKKEFPGEEKILEVFKNFQIAEFNVSYINKILALLKKHNIETVVITGAVNRAQLKLWKEYKVQEQTNRLIKAQLDRYDNVLDYWDMAGSVTDLKFYADPLHLTHEGANLYSLELIRRLKEIL